MFKGLYYVSVILLFVALFVNVWSIVDNKVNPLIGIALAFISVTLYFYFRYKARQEIENTGKK